MKNRIGLFFTVGALGFVVQMATLAFLTTTLHWQYELAVAAAVEVAILHNFWWHQRWTWCDRLTAADSLKRLGRFHIGAGCISMAGNLAGTAYLVEYLHLGPLTANLCAVACTSFANFLVADRWVFTGQSRTPEVVRAET